MHYYLALREDAFILFFFPADQHILSDFRNKPHRFLPVLLEYKRARVAIE